MKLMTRALGAVTGILAFASLTGGIAAAADRPYTEGSVVNVAAVRTEPGMFEEYMKYLAGPYKQVMEEQKKAGIIVDYAIYAADPRSPHDPDLYLVTVYKNMAALDDLNAKTDGIAEKIVGTLEQQSAATVQRGKLRTLLGNEYIRELNLK
jgi:L-rhamnose mutarotase